MASIIVFLENMPEDFKEFEKKGVKITGNFKTIPGFFIELPKNKIYSIAELDIVTDINLNQPVSGFLNDSIPIIKANEVWDQGITGSGVKVCVVDTGIDYNHPALKDKVIAQIDTINNDSDAMDDNGHGTHVAGAIASNDSNYKGVAPDVSLLIAKALDSDNKGDYKSIVQAIDWCAWREADVINLSLGSIKKYDKSCNNDALARIVNRIVNDYDIVVSASAGNDGKEGMGSPGCASQAIAVGAVDKSGHVPYWSSRGSEMDILAPGVNIFSSNLNNKFVSGNGTSFAAPQVSGGIALMLEAVSGATNRMIKQALYSTTNKAAGCSECGYFWKETCQRPKINECAKSDAGTGIINLSKALLILKSMAPTPSSVKKEEIGKEDGYPGCPLCLDLPLQFKLTVKGIANNVNKKINCVNFNKSFTLTYQGTVECPIYRLLLGNQYNDKFHYWLSEEIVNNKRYVLHSLAYSEVKDNKICEPYLGLVPVNELPCPGLHTSWVPLNKRNWDCKSINSWVLYQDDGGCSYPEQGFISLETLH